MFYLLTQIIDGDCVSSFPVYPQPFLYPTCPNVQPGSVGICLQNCSSDSDCTNGQKCCSNGCGRACTQPTLVPYYNVSAQQCSHVRAQFNVTRRPLPGAYIPQCDSGGYYSPVHCASLQKLVAHLVYRYTYVDKSYRKTSFNCIV